MFIISFDEHTCMVFFLVYLEVYRPTQEFFTHMETSPLLVKGCNFDLCSALTAIEQWGFFNVPHGLRHRPIIYNGHLQRLVTLTPVAEHLAVELSLPVFTTWVCRDRGSNPDLLHARRTLYLYATNKSNLKTKYML